MNIGMDVNTFKPLRTEYTPMLLCHIFIYIESRRLNGFRRFLTANSKYSFDVQ